MLTRGQMIVAARQPDLSQPLAADGNPEPQTVSPFQTLRRCAEMMAESKLTSYPVVTADGKLQGVMTINDLLQGRSEQAHREFDRERVLRLRWPFSKPAEKTSKPKDDIPSPPDETGAAA